MAEFTSETNKIKLRGSMQPDTYKPIFSVSVLPVDKETDGFHNADYGNPASRIKTNFLLASLSLFTLILCKI